MDMDVETLRETEARCIRKFQQKASALRATDPRLDAGLARAKAYEALPKTTAAYLNAVQRLQHAGHAARQWK
jgi:hypothetical protein